MVVLSLVERLRGLDLRHDRRAPVPLLSGLRLHSGLLLLGVVEEDRGTVVVTDVPALTVELRRVVLRPEDVEQLVVRDPVGVVGDLDHLGVTGLVRADVLVGRVFHLAAGVADARRGHSVELTERRLDAPEAAGAECCLLLHYSSSSSSAAELMQ